MWGAKNGLEGDDRRGETENKSGHKRDGYTDKETRQRRVKAKKWKEEKVRQR